MSNKWVTSYDQGLAFALLQPSHSPVREDVDFDLLLEGVYNRSDIMQVFSSIDEGETVALDLETRGTDFAIPYEADVTRIVGIGLAWSKGRVYFDIQNLPEHTYQFLLQQVSKLSGHIIAHNVFFDFGFLTRDCIYFNVQVPTWEQCTYALYRFLATEGMQNQKWGLKSAQVDLLEWEVTNEVELDNWLIEHKYVKGGIKQKQEESDDDYSKRYTFWVEDNEYHEDPKKRPRADKSQMWRAPSPILGHYCKLDCESTYLLYKKILLPVLVGFKTLERYIDIDWRRITELLIEAKIRGIVIDKELLEQHGKVLEAEIEEARLEIYNHTDLREWIAEYHLEIENEHRAKEPPRYKKKPKLGTEPKRLKKDGAVSKNWINWNEKRDKLNVMRREIRKDWLVWEEKLHAIMNLELPKFRFNPNSGDQLRSLFYYSGMIDYEISKEATVKPNGKKFPGEVKIHPGTLSEVALPTTDSGLLPTSGDALKQFGSAGEPFVKFNKADKELSYVNAYLDLLQYNEEEDIYTIHPGYNVPGTLTGRLGGKEPNLQQVPASYGTTRPWLPREGYVWYEIDHNSLEQVVLAELSKDDTLDSLYGADALDNDVYLFVGAQLPVIGSVLQSHGYDPYNPTVEAILATKKKCKRERSIAKVVVLASSYGAGAGKIWRTLMLLGVRLKFNEVKQIIETYWELFDGVKLFEKELHEEMKSRGGWFFNGIGRPVGLDERKLKDVVNQNCQSTGHDCHVIFMRIVADLLDEREIEWYPVIPDWHDQMIIEIRPEDADVVNDLIERVAYDMLNEAIGFDIPLAGEGQVVTNLAEVKVEDYDAIEDAMIAAEYEQE